VVPTVVLITTRADQTADTVTILILQGTFRLAMNSVLLVMDHPEKFVMSTRLLFLEFIGGLHLLEEREIILQPSMIDPGSTMTTDEDPLHMTAIDMFLLLQKCGAAMVLLLNLRIVVTMGRHNRKHRRRRQSLSTIDMTADRTIGTLHPTRHLLGRELERHQSPIRFNPMRVKGGCTFKGQSANLFNHPIVEVRLISRQCWARI
jgi:hypothetical protein